MYHFFADETSLALFIYIRNEMHQFCILKINVEVFLSILRIDTKHHNLFCLSDSVRPIATRFCVHWKRMPMLQAVVLLLHRNWVLNLFVDPILSKIYTEIIRNVGWCLSLEPLATCCGVFHGSVYISVFILTLDSCFFLHCFCRSSRFSHFNITVLISSCASLRYVCLIISFFFFLFLVCFPKVSHLLK